MDLIGDVRSPLKAVWPPARLQLPYTKRLSRCVLFGLLTTLGLLAFCFSVVSPNDDDVQQEFLQSSKSRQCFLANYKTVSSRTFRICTVRSALSPPTTQFASYDVTARVSAPDDEIKGRICSSRTGDRSPPPKTS
jgi:hypothetical protein